MDRTTAHRRLEEQRRRIEQGLEDLRRPRWEDELGEVAEEGAPYGETADALLRERLEGELAMLTRAERRLRDGTYGISVESGRPIPQERLRANPLAERTVEEQRRFDLHSTMNGSASPAGRTSGDPAGLGSRADDPPLTDARESMLA